jgi:hypothetical protein
VWLIPLVKVGKACSDSGSGRVLSNFNLESVNQTVEGLQQPKNKNETVVEDRRIEHCNG